MRRREQNGKGGNRDRGQLRLHGYQPMVGNLFRLYRATGSLELRNQLILGFQWWVERMASYFRRHLPEPIELDDLVSAANFGLMDAINGYDPDKGSDFDIYAFNRIRGAIIDYLRTQMWQSRSAYRRITSYKELIDKLGHRPSQEELVKHLEISPEEAGRIETAVNQQSQLVQESTGWRRDGDWRGFHFNHQPVLNDYSYSNDQTPLERLIAAEGISPRFLIGLTSLGKKVIIGYYAWGMTMNEVGQILNISKSRVSQIHCSAIKTIKGNLNGAGTVAEALDQVG
mgnify:CR=1 FL=1